LKAPEADISLQRMKTIEDLLIPTGNPGANQIRPGGQEPVPKSLTKESPPSGSNHQMVLKQESVSPETKAKKRILKGQEKVKAVVQRAI